LNISTTLAKQKIKTLAIGCFDGLHLGHLELIKHLGDNSALLIVDKFKGKKLCSDEEKALLSQKDLILLDFNSIKDLEAKEFLNLLKKEFVNLETLVVGYDFAFGKNACSRAEDIELLSSFKACVVPAFKINNQEVHTRLIKEFLSKAELSKAEEFLGRAYSVKGTLVSGQGLASKELFATLNLECGDYFLPKQGVYASYTELENQSFKSVSFIGIRSSDGNFAVETHILEDFSLHTYKGQNVKITFKKFLRQNQKFTDLSLLKKQISKDIEQALLILRNDNER